MSASNVRSIWIAALLTVAVPYTVIAFDMQWRTVAGRIGPGFFPRVIGLALVCSLLVALVRSLPHSAARRKEGHHSEAGGAARAAPRGDLRTLSLIVGATVVFLVLLEPLGALPSAVAYMLGVLAVLNPRRWVVNIPVALALPVSLYLLFETWLNAGLPRGVLAFL